MGMQVEYKEYADIVENRYFGNVAGMNFSAVLECFTEDATVMIYHGDNPPRHFSRDGKHGDILINFFEHLTGNFTARFENFVHYIDPQANRCASRFLVTLDPLPESDYFSNGQQQLNNCNFFDFRGGLIEHMIVYYSNSRAQSEATPTGYPKEGWVKT